MRKKMYEVPEIRLHGDIRSITRAASSGLVLDADFPAGTSFSSATFS